MGVEIERKFLVTGDGWKAEADGGTAVRQGYLANEKRLSVRIRVKGDKGYVTIKGEGKGLARPEFEYEIPKDDAETLLTSLCLPEQIAKTRYLVRHGRHTWEVDVFEGANAPLVLAELELQDADEAFDRPSWIGQDVSDDPRYLNARLAANPFGRWVKS